MSQRQMRIGQDESPLLRKGPIERVSIGSLVQSGSLRLAGGNKEHAHILAESDMALPPIIVHRSTRHVIDGMHRLAAAELRGETEISVVFYDGSEEDAFILAVQANIERRRASDGFARCSPATHCCPLVGAIVEGELCSHISVFQRRVNAFTEPCSTVLVPGSTNWRACSAGTRRGRRRKWTSSASSAWSGSPGSSRGRCARSNRRRGCSCRWPASAPIRRACGTRSM